MNIEMIPYDKGYIIPENGKYLVRTKSTYGNTFENIRFIQATCQINEKKDGTSIDVNHQIVTHISKQKLM